MFPSTAARYIVHLETSKKILLRRVMLDTQWLQEDWVCTNLYSTVLTWSHHIKSVLAWRVFFKPEKWDLFVASDFSISYTQNCTVSSYNFEKISGEGLTEPPPQTPPPLLLGLRPRFSGASRPRLGLRPRICPPPRSQPGPILGWAPPSIFVWLRPWAWRRRNNQQRQRLTNLRSRSKK